MTTNESFYIFVLYEVKPKASYKMKNLYSLLSLSSFSLLFAFATNAQSVIRTQTYHQVTKFTESHSNAQDWQHVLSDDGNKIVWYKQTNPKKVIVINPDGSGIQELVDMGTDRLSQVDISADGTKIVYIGGPGPDGHHVNFINSNGSGDLDLVGFNGLHTHTVKISGDGNNVFFNLYTNSSYIGGGSAERGIYYISPSGTGLNQVVSPAQVATAIGINATDVGTFYGGGSGQSVDASYDGSRIIFIAKDNSNGNYTVLTATGGGGSVTKIHDAYYIGAVGISRDGEKIAFTTNESDGNRQGWVANFDGSAKVKLADNFNDYYFTNGNSQGDAVSLTANGSQVMFDGQLGHLFNSDGSGVMQVTAPTIGGAGYPLISEGLPRATMSSNGSSFLYSFLDPVTNLVQLSMLYVNPGALGSSPTLSEIGTNPNTISISPQTASTFTARLTPANGSDSIKYIGNATLLNNRLDIKVPAKTFYDDGVSVGDVTANDMLYTHWGINASSDAVPGPRTMRINAEIIDAGGYVHGTSVDIEPFYVVPDTTFIGITEINGVNNNFTLEQNYPNPFSTNTNIKFHLNKASKVLLEVYNVTGELQATLINTEMATGSYQIPWDGQNLASGMYFFKMQASGAIQTQEFIIAK